MMIVVHKACTIDTKCMHLYVTSLGIVTLISNDLEIESMQQYGITVYPDNLNYKLLSRHNIGPTE